MSNPLVALFFLITLPVALLGQNTVGEFSYTNNPDGITATIVKYHGPGGTVIIPSEIAGLMVTSIGKEAFFEAGLTNVAFPNSVTNLGLVAFADNFDLSAIYFDGEPPASSDSVFENDYDAVVYYFPFWSFAWGDSYGGIPISVVTNAVSFFFYSLSTNDGASIVGVASAAPFASIPSSLAGAPITAIEASAFDEDFLNFSPANVYIPDSVGSLEGFAFAGDYNLSSLIVGEGVTNIGMEVFAFNFALTGVLSRKCAERRIQLFFLSESDFLSPRHDWLGGLIGKNGSFCRSLESGSPISDLAVPIPTALVQYHWREQHSRHNSSNNKSHKSAVAGNRNRKSHEWRFPIYRSRMVEFS